MKNKQLETALDTATFLLYIIFAITLIKINYLALGIVMVVISLIQLAQLLNTLGVINLELKKEPLTGEKQGVSYNEADLVGFGNYLFSKEREEFYKKEKSSLPLKDRLKQVNDTDLKRFSKKSNSSLA